MEDFVVSGRGVTFGDLFEEYGVYFAALSLGGSILFPRDVSVGFVLQNFDCAQLQVLHSDSYPESCAQVEGGRLALYLDGDMLYVWVGERVQFDREVMRRVRDAKPRKLCLMGTRLRTIDDSWGFFTSSRVQMWGTIVAHNTRIIKDVSCHVQMIESVQLQYLRVENVHAVRVPELQVLHLTGSPIGSMFRALERFEDDNWLPPRSEPLQIRASHLPNLRVLISSYDIAFNARQEQFGSLTHLELSNKASGLTGTFPALKVLYVHADDIFEVNNAPLKLRDLHCPVLKNMFCREIEYNCHFPALETLVSLQSLDASLDLPSVKFVNAGAGLKNIIWREDQTCPPLPSLVGGAFVGQIPQPSSTVRSLFLSNVSLPRSDVCDDWPALQQIVLHYAQFPDNTAHIHCANASLQACRYLKAVYHAGRGWLEVYRCKHVQIISCSAEKVEVEGANELGSVVCSGRRVVLVHCDVGHKDVAFKLHAPRAEFEYRLNEGLTENVDGEDVVSQLPESLVGDHVQIRSGRCVRKMKYRGNLLDMGNINFSDDLLVVIHVAPRVRAEMWPSPWMNAWKYRTEVISAAGAEQWHSELMVREAQSHPRMVGTGAESVLRRKALEWSVWADLPHLQPSPAIPGADDEMLPVE